MTEPGMEFVEPEPDDSEAAQQSRPIDPIDLPTTVHRGLEIDEIDEADALDQARDVDLDDESEER